MTRRTSLLLSIMLLACYSALATDRTLAAEGDYVSQQYPKRPAHWKLWHLRDGTYEVEETLLRGNVVQVFRFDSQFLPTGFSLTIDPDKARSKVLPQKPPFTPRTMISCRYGVQDLTCESEKNGKTSASSIPVKQPYVVVPGEFYALDYLWLMTGVLRLTEQNHSEDNSVNVYIMVDDKLHAYRPVQVTYAGKQTARVMGKTQPVTEYEVWVAGRKPGAWLLSGLSVLQVTAHGLVASVRGKPDRGLGFAIGNYKEYEPWMLSR